MARQPAFLQPDADSYAYTQRLDGPGWAWEFLRRHQGYAETWGAARRFFGTDPISPRLNPEIRRLLAPWRLIFRR